MCEGNDVWFTADKAVREIAPLVLSEAGYTDEAEELRRLQPISNKLSAEAACHVALLLIDKVRWAMDSRAQALVEHAMSVAFAASQGQRDAVARYVQRLVATGTKMLGAEWMVATTGIASASP